MAGDPPPRSVHYGAVNEGTAEVGVVGGGVEDDRASVASFASLEDAEETVRARGGAATGTASANNASLKQKPSVFEMFAEIRDGRTRDGTHRSSAPTKAVTIDSEASAITSAPTQQIVLLDGMHRVRTRTASSSSSKAANLFADSNNSIGAAYCDPPPPRSHSHSHHHHEPSMNDLSFLMREQDADLLESIQRKAANDDTNDTPQKQQQQIAAASAAAAAGADSDGIVAAAATSIDAASEALDKDGSALSTIPPPTAEVPRKKPHRIPPAALQVPPIPAPDAGSGTVAPAAAAAPATTPTSSRQRAKPASLRTLLIRHESGDAAGAAPASLVRRSSQASGGGIGIGDGLDDHGSVGTEGTSATVVGERARKALSGEIWVLPEDVPPTASPPISAAVSFGADVPPPPASLDRVPMPSPKRTERSSVSVPAIAEGDETLTVPSFGHDDDDDDADSKKTKDSKSQSSVAAPTAKIVRSESHDRRLNEAAQFAEAVGELQLAEQNELMIIEEDRNDGGDYDFDDDTDDDATEIHVEGVEAGGGSSSSPKRRTVVMGMQGVPVEVSVLHQPHKARPQWPFRTKRTKGGFLDKLPETGTSATQNFVYKGIRANPPEIVSRGVTRGNYSCLHRKAWLECTDKYRTFTHPRAFEYF